MRSALGAVFVLVCSACEYTTPADNPDDAGTGPFVGQVALLWAPTSFGVTANFTTPDFSAELGTTPAQCAGTVMGNCCLYAQPQLDPSNGDAEPLTVSAGTLTVSDGASALGTATFSGIGYVPISSAETATLAWNPGDTLFVSAAGASVDGFSGSVVAPAAFVGVSPDLTLTGQIVVHLNQDFTISWAPAAGSTAMVDVQLFDPVGAFADCAALDSAGAITVPSAVLGTLGSGDNGYVTLSRPQSTQLQVGNTTTTLTAAATDVGLATFQ